MRRLAMMLAVAVAMALPAAAQGYWQEAAPSKGYKGFVEAGYAFGIQFHDDYYYDYSREPSWDQVSVLTTHGVQFSQFVFFGAGVGINYYKQLDWTNVPIYGAFRFMMPLSVAPYVDIKVGYSAGKIDGLYGSVGMGCRFPINGRTGFNIGVNLDLQHCDRQLMPSARSDYYYHDDYYLDGVTAAIAIRAGIDF